MKRSAEVCLNSDWRKQGKLFAHSRHCCYQEDLIIRDWCQGVQKQLIGLLALLAACWVELLLGRCEKQWRSEKRWSTKEPHTSPQRLNQCPEGALEHLTHLLSDQTPGDKLGNFDSHKHRWSTYCWVSWVISLDISTLCPLSCQDWHKKAKEQRSLKSALRFQVELSLPRQRVSAGT